MSLGPVFLCLWIFFYFPDFLLSPGFGDENSAERKDNPSGGSCVTEAAPLATHPSLDRSAVEIISAGWHAARSQGWNKLHRHSQSNLMGGMRDEVSAEENPREFPLALLSTEEPRRA